MDTLNIPNTDLNPSVLCLGTANIGVRNTEAEAHALFDAFVSHGGAFIDTARVYSNWIPGELNRSERIIGDWLAKRRDRDRLIIATKGGHFNLEDRIPRLSAEELETDLSGSLHKLQTDYIDLYWLHRDDINRPVAELLDILHAFQQAGKIRHYACSNWTPERIQEANACAQKKGYSGVLTLSKMPPDLVEAGIGLPQYDQEGRVLRTDYGDITLLNCYFPSGTTGDVRQEVKMNFLADFYEWVLELRKSRPNIIIVGDYNIAHNEIDIHDPKGNKKSSGFLPEERAWMDLWFANGFIDTFRYKYPERVGYSWWTFRANARANNKGWRIDYISVTAPLKDAIYDAGLLPEVVHSDHCGIWLVLK